MSLQKRIFFTKTQAGELISQNTIPSDSEHILTIEAHQNGNAGTHELINDVEYHLYDNWSASDLPGIHVVVTAKYNDTKKIGDRFRLDTRPYAFKNNFGAVMKWDPKDIVQGITLVEKSIAECIRSKFLFSVTKDWEIQYYGLIHELYRKLS